jgi:hypothetical protein
MLPSSQKISWIILPLVGFLLSFMAACTPHERFHQDLYEAHGQFHAYPHTRTEHRRLHRELEELHRDYHDYDYD